MNDPIITRPSCLLPQNRIGMTVREEIASRVLAGMFACQDFSEFSADERARSCVIYADALIKELERTKK